MIIYQIEKEFHQKFSVITKLIISIKKLIFYNPSIATQIYHNIRGKKMLSEKISHQI